MVSWKPVVGVDHYNVSVFNGVTDVVSTVPAGTTSLAVKGSSNPCAQYRVTVGSRDANGDGVNRPGESGDFHWPPAGTTRWPFTCTSLGQNEQRGEPIGVAELAAAVVHGPRHGPHGTDLADTAITDSCAVAQFHLTGTDKSVFAFHTQLTPGHFTDLIASARALAATSLLANASAVLGWEVDLEPVDRLAAEAQVINLHAASGEDDEGSTTELG